MDIGLLLIIIFLLIIYTIYLHLQISKKSKEIDNIRLKLTQIDKYWDNNYVIEYIRTLIETKSFNLPKAKSDLFTSDYIKKFILHNIEEINTYIHYTAEEEIAKKILKEGFKFSSNFHKTAELITNDEVELVYKHSLRKLYGNYIVIICISKKIFDYYINELKNKNKHDIVSAEQILIEKPVEKDDSLEDIFTLSNKYIKGYINYISGEITKNPEFNPDYDSEIFKQNIEKSS